MIVLVFGGRLYGQGAGEEDHFSLALDLCHSATPISKIIQGGATGADALARAWAFRRRVPVETYYPNWHQHGPAAGPRRNYQMVHEGKPDLAIGFPGGKGTASMLRIARNYNIKVLLP